MPTLDLPTRANSGKPSEGQSSVLTLLLINSAWTICASLAYLLNTILDPFKTLALKPLLFSLTETSVSGGIKSLSSENWVWVCSWSANKLWASVKGMGSVVVTVDLSLERVESLSLVMRGRLIWVYGDGRGWVNIEKWSFGSRERAISLGCLGVFKRVEALATMSNVVLTKEGRRKGNLTTD